MNTELVVLVGSHMRSIHWQVCNVMSDQHKALDTFNHSILLNKLQAIFLTAHLWTGWDPRSYLEGREQVVEVNSTMSSSLPVDRGVKHSGDVSFLDLCYWREISMYRNWNLLLFTDDSSFLVTDSGKFDVVLSAIFVFGFQITNCHCTLDLYRYIACWGSILL